MANAPKKPAKVGPVVVVDPKGPLPDGAIHDMLEQIAQTGLPVIDPFPLLQAAAGPKPRPGKRKPARKGNDG